MVILVSIPPGETENRIGTGKASQTVVVLVYPFDGDNLTMPEMEHGKIVALDTEAIELIRAALAKNMKLNFTIFGPRLGNNWKEDADRFGLVIPGGFDRSGADIVRQHA